jgi:alkanesulfonate monooxygenase SsuD/methylene tetrahydromethanopterin reductase-like flavin-dependent oxidoreductase (luciferase family)
MKGNTQGAFMKIGVILGIEGNEQVGMPRYREVRDLALRAEQAGLDSIWLYDHLLFRSNAEPPVGHWDCFTFLAGLAEATQRVELGTLVACTAFRNPALLAKMATALDEVSGGRFILGIGAGWNEPEFTAFGFPFDHRVSRFEEALQIIAPLMRTGQVDFAGTYYRVVDCLDIPRGPRPNGPPLLVAGSGPRMIRLAARYADSINTAFNIDDPLNSQAALAGACAEVGRDPATLAITIPGWAAFPDLDPTPPHMQQSTFASAEALAGHMRQSATAGIAHIMYDFRPNNVAGLQRVADALQLYRQVNQ